MTNGNTTKMGKYYERSGSNITVMNMEEKPIPP